ncbi:HEAT repeat-containing protein [Synechococcus sp. PCC 7502]|uniref:HEAT repeat domain-containing protein n=1 Tax=Synechococcus sp. PCC 7502 TaxID=1173263 RepID=UPI00029F8123|nr:HEAT repeat domain-containing protein [Synechococcus sp. PCC 7502]AFY75165.1 HEAT repeat-containing protein [Synechococcus sp. PCC 7502]
MHEQQSNVASNELTIATAIANLRSPDLSLRYYAAWWLGKMRVYEAVDILLVALEDSEDRTELGGYPLRRNAARSLGKLGNPKAIPALIIALNCEDFYVREAAAQAIEEIASHAQGYVAAQVAVLPLAKLLTSKDYRDLDQPYEAILEALGRLKAQSVKHLIEPFLNHIVLRIRLAAARSMYGLTSDPYFANLLIEALSGSDVNIRRVALTDLGEIGYLPAAEAIAQTQTENSFKLFALRGILDTHLPNVNQDPQLLANLQQVMLLMDDLL